MLGEFEPEHGNSSTHYSSKTLYLRDFKKWPTLVVSSRLDCAAAAQSWFKC